MSNSKVALARVEQCNVTLAQTKSFLAGLVVDGISVRDVSILLNLKRAYEAVIQLIENSQFKIDKTGLRLSSLAKYDRIVLTDTVVIE